MNDPVNSNCNDNCHLCDRTKSWTSRRDLLQRVRFYHAQDKSNKDTAPTISKTMPVFLSAVILTAMMFPIVENFKDRRDRIDSFPLSYYPMFSSRRDNLYAQRSVIGVKSNGDQFPLNYRMLGPGGLNQVRRQLNKLARDDDPQSLTQMLERAAESIRKRNLPPYSQCVKIVAIRGHYDLDAYFSGGEKRPVRVEVLASVPVRDEADADRKNQLLGSHP